MSAVVVVGGGLAGISAALRLADGGRSVTLLEGRPRLGGAAFSFARGDLSIDNGQHVFLRCCDAYRALVHRIGADLTNDAGLRHHVSFADPYCPVVAAAAVDAATHVGVPVHARGTVVVVQGPRFSTRAESAWFRAQGWDVVNMTQYPEAWLARELELCYATVALVTDYDVGLEDMPHIQPVSAEAAFRVFAENLDRLRDLLFRAIPRIGPQPEDVCATALTSAIVH